MWCSSLWRDFLLTVAINNFLRSKNSKGNFKIFLKKVVRGNAVQIFSIFPPKVLVFKR